MKVAIIREHLISRVAEVIHEGTLDDVLLMSDRLRVLAGALASLPSDADVDLRTCTVDTAQAAQMLSYHAEHVRRLIRQGRIASSKDGVDYRIPLNEIFALLARRHYSGPLPELLFSADEDGNAVSPANGDFELAIDVSVMRGSERHSVRLQRINVELGELLRDQLGKGEEHFGGELGG